MPAKKKVPDKAAAKKKTSKKAGTKKKTSKIASAKTKSSKKPAAKKSPETRTLVSEGEFFTMVREAAYFAAENDGNRKSDTDYWMEAESAVRTKYTIG